VRDLTHDTVADADARLGHPLDDRSHVSGESE
jgi:hypothetical protein